MEELTENAEENDEGESKQSEQKLGKVQYKVLRGSRDLIRCTIFWLMFRFSLNTTSTRTPWPWPWSRRKSCPRWTWEVLPIRTSKSTCCRTRRKSSKPKSTGKPSIRYLTNRSHSRWVQLFFRNLFGVFVVLSSIPISLYMYVAFSYGFSPFSSPSSIQNFDHGLSCDWKRVEIGDGFRPFPAWRFMARFDALFLVSTRDSSFSEHFPWYSSFQTL